LIISELEAVHMENGGYLELARLFGKESIWGNKYLPCSENKTDGVLSKLLDQETGYDKYIGSLQSYRSDYAQFSDAYYRNLPPGAGKEQYTCVPYWGSEFWKPKTSLRLAVFAQRSLNEDGASIPLYFPLCEIPSWEKAFEIGVKIGEKQPGKEPPKTPFSWQSFMSVWIAMRFLFSKNADMLQHVYYSDLKKLSDPKKNMNLLEVEISIINPKLVLILGKGGYEEFKGVFDKKKIELHYICFPCGNGVGHDPHAEKLLACQKELAKIFG
jgi:hypothetical protein